MNLVFLFILVPLTFACYEQKCESQSTEKLRVLTPSILYACVKQQSLLLYKNSDEELEAPDYAELSFKQGEKIFNIRKSIPHELALKNSFKFYFEHSIPSSMHGDGLFKIALKKANGGEISQVNTTLAKVVALDDWVIFETTKPIYKNDDVIKARIFVESASNFQALSGSESPECLREKQEPSINNITVTLTNSKKEVVANWYLQNASSYLNIEYPLSENSKLGVWKFIIEYKNKAILKPITVVRYESTGSLSSIAFDSLPNFIGSSENVTDNWNITICGRLTSGELTTAKPMIKLCICKDLSRSGVRLSRHRLLSCEKPDYFHEEQEYCYFKHVDNVKGCASLSYSVKNWRNEDSELDGILQAQYMFNGSYPSTERVKRDSRLDYFVKSNPYLDPLFPTHVQIRWPIYSLNGTYIVSLESQSGMKLKSLFMIAEEEMKIILPPSKEILKLILYEITPNNSWSLIKTLTVMTNDEPLKSQNRIKLLYSEPKIICENNSKTYILMSAESIDVKEVKIMSQDKGKLFDQPISLEPYVFSFNNDSLINFDHVCKNGQCNCQNNQCARVVNGVCSCIDVDFPKSLESLYFYQFTINNLTAFKPSFRGILYYVMDDLQIIVTPIVINRQDISFCRNRRDPIQISLSRSSAHPGNYIDLEVNLNGKTMSEDKVDECFVNIYDEEIMKTNPYDYPLHIFDENAYLDILSKKYPARNYIESLGTNPLEQTNMYVMNSCSHKRSFERQSQLMYYPFSGNKETFFRESFDEKKEYFPSSLLFTQFKIFNENLSIPIRVPEALTTWKLNAYCRTKQGALIEATGKNRSLVVSQSYKIVTSIPDELFVDEVFFLPVKIVQYSQELNRQNNMYDLLHSNSMHSNSNNLTLTKLKTMLINTYSDGWNETEISVKMTKTGDFKLKLAAKLNKGSKDSMVNSIENQYFEDTVEKKVKVLSEFPAEERSLTFFACLNDYGQFSATKLLDLPRGNLITDSFTYSFEVAKSPISIFKNSIDVLEKMPLTPVEMNLLFTASQTQHVLELWKIKQSKQFDASLVNQKKVAEYLENIRQSYFKILKFVDSQGSILVWPDTLETKSSTWLTAIVAQVFINLLDKIGVAKLGFNPSSMIKKNVLHIMSKFSKDVCFEMDAYEFWSALPSEKDNQYLYDLFLSQTLYKAKIGNTFSGDTENNAKLDSVISNVIKCLKGKRTNMNSDNILYTQYVYAKSLINKFAKVSAEEQNDMWTKIKASLDVDEENEEINFKSDAVDHAVKIQHNLYAYLSVHERLSDVEKARFIKWLLNQRDSIGGFKSMLNALLALEVLSTYYSSFEKPVRVEFSEKKFNSQKKETLFTDMLSISYDYAPNVNRNNNSIIPKSIRMSVTLSGDQKDAKKCMPLQLKASYNIRKHTSPINKKNLSVKTFTADNSTYRLSVCLKYSAKIRILKIKPPSGFEMLYEEPIFPKVYEESNKFTKNIFIDEFGSSEKCLQLKFNKKFYVCNIKPGYVRLYEGYSYYIRRSVEEIAINFLEDSSCDRYYELR